MLKEDQNETVNVNEESLLLHTSRNSRSYKCRCNKCCQSCYEKIKLILEQEAYKKFLYALIWWLLTGYLTGLTNAIADNRSFKTYPCNAFLRDLGFDFVSLFINTDQTYINPYATDICLYIAIISMAIYILKTQTKKEIFNVMIRYIVMFNVLFTLRSLNICLTVFPTPSRQKLTYSCEKWSDVAVAPFLIASGSRMSCSDFFFSGHTTNAMISALIVTKYINKDHDEMVINGNKRLLWIRLMFVVYIWFTVFLVVLFLLILETHYSIDISTAIMLTTLFWYIAEYQIQLDQGFFNWWNVSS